MAEKEESKRTFTTGMEGFPFAEMMQKMMGGQGAGSMCAEMMQKMTGGQGTGSICAEMLKKVGDKKESGGSFPCAGMMEAMMKGCCGTEAKKETQKEKETGDK